MKDKLRKKIVNKIRIMADIIENPLLSRIKFLGLDIHFAKDCLEIKDILGKEPETVLDIGANYGKYSATASYIFPKAKVYSFEPLKECYLSILEFQKKFPNIIAINSAVSEKNGKINFYKNDFMAASSYKKMLDKCREEFPGVEKETIIQVNSLRIDDFFKNKDIGHGVFMKIDVQGAELDVLKSAYCCLDYVDIIMLEVCLIELYEGMSAFDDVYQYLRAKGFKFIDILNREFSSKSKKTIFFDAIFVKKYT